VSSLESYCIGGKSVYEVAAATEDEYAYEAGAIFESDQPSEADLQ
jgi:hypothetical protein